MPLSLRHLALVLSIGMQATLCWAERTGPVVVGQTFMAGGLEPACDCSDPWALTSHGISEKLFTVDKDGNVVGQVAQSAVKVSEFVWDVTLKSGYKFSDGTPGSHAHLAQGRTRKTARQD